MQTMPGMIGGKKRVWKLHEEMYKEAVKNGHRGSMVKDLKMVRNKQ